MLNHAGHASKTFPNTNLHTLCVFLVLPLEGSCIGILAALQLDCHPEGQLPVYYAFTTPPALACRPTSYILLTARRLLRNLCARRSRDLSFFGMHHKWFLTGCLLPFLTPFAAIISFMGVAQLVTIWLIMRRACAPYMSLNYLAICLRVSILATPWFRGPICSGTSSLCKCLHLPVRSLWHLTTGSKSIKGYVKALVIV